jgi:hypothetical protein
VAVIDDGVSLVVDNCDALSSARSKCFSDCVGVSTGKGHGGLGYLSPAVL